MKKFYLSFFVILIITFSFKFSNSQNKNNPFSELDNSKINTGLLYNKVKIPLSKIHECNGVTSVITINDKQWRDIYYEVFHSLSDKNISNYQTLKSSIKKDLRKNIFKVGVINYSYNEFKKDALKKGLVEVVNNKFIAKSENIYDEHHVFVSSIIQQKQYTGKNVVFDFSKDYYYSNYNSELIYFDVNFANGTSFQKVKPNDKIKINYSTDGIKTIIVKANFKNGKVLTSKFSIKISTPKMPYPSDLWTDYTADEAYLGEYAQGEVGIFYGSGNADFTRPVIIVDGFDPGDTRDIAGLWDIANQENMVDNLRAEGYDFVIVNFYGGDDYIQRNAFLVKKVIQEINARMTSAGTMKSANQIAVIGPSMGGLITRYAIRNMEQNGINHNVRNWISFDSPMKGADIPLGLQHWVRFFADEGEVGGAQDAKVSLSGPAAKQMLIYHYTATSGNTANSNGLFTSFYNELNAMGFPEQTRIVAIANGSGYSANQGFDAGDQVVDYTYRSFAVDIDGNIWAVPNQTYQRIFQGGLNKVWPLSDSYESIYVNNTLPYDGAPGGKRNTFLELDETDTGGYGDIVALHDSHSFIPTISSMCVQNTNDPYFNINDNINTLITPFDKLYYPHENQDHVAITPESYLWFYHEVINFAPQFTSIPVTSVNEDENYTYTLSATDENEWNVLSYEIIEKPSWLNFNATTGEFSGTPLNEDVGTHNVSVKVKDELDETIQNFTITVANINDAPVITSTAIDEATEDEIYSYLFTASDEDPTNDVLTLSAVNIPSWLSFNATNGLLFGMPSNEDVGTHNVTLRVNDGTIDVDQTFTITVANVNDAPVITSSAIQTAVEDVEYLYTFTATDEDPIPDVLTLSAVTIPTWLSFDEATGILSGTPLNEDVGTYNVTLNVNDGIVDVNQNFTITVVNVNDAPIITSIANEVATEEIEYTYTFTATDEDPTSDILTLSAITIPNWLNFDNVTGILSGTPLNEDVGMHNIILRVNDGTANVDQSFTITVANVNDAPIITSTEITSAIEDIEYSYTFTVTDEDPNPDVLTFSAVEIPTWLSFDASTGILLGTPLNENVGNHNITLRVNDGTVDVDQSFTITVANVNDAPIITSTEITSATEDIEYSYTFTVTDEDPNPDVLTFSAVEIPTWLSFDASTGILSGTPLNENVGTHNVTLRVNDGTVDVDQTFTITVANVNDAPILQNELIDQETYTEELFTYTFAENSFNDVDAGDILVYSVSLADGSPIPTWLSFNSNTKTFEGTPTVANNYDIKITAYDTSFANVSDVFSLNVLQSISINDVDSNNIKIYPNPTSDFLYISLNKGFSNIQVIDVAGKMIKNIQVNDSNNLEINVSNINSGIYFVKFINDNEIILKKIIIQK